MGRKPEAPTFGQAQRPPLPPVSPRSLPCHSFSGISLGKTREAGDVRPKRSKEKGQGRTGGSFFGEKSVQSRGAVAPHPAGKKPQGGSVGREGEGEWLGEA